MNIVVSNQPDFEVVIAFDSLKERHITLLTPEGQKLPITVFERVQDGFTQTSHEVELDQQRISVESKPKVTASIA